MVVCHKVMPYFNLKSADALNRYPFSSDEEKQKGKF